MRRLLKYIPLHMEKDFLRYAYEKHKLIPDKIDSYVQLEIVASEYLFKNKKKEKKNKKTKIEKTEKEIFDGICTGKFSEVSWNKVTEIAHCQVLIADSVTPVCALEIMYGDELIKRLVMRDYDKSLRFMSHVYDVWFSS